MKRFSGVFGLAMSLLVLLVACDAHRHAWADSSDRDRYAWPRLHSDG